MKKLAIFIFILGSFISIGYIFMNSHSALHLSSQSLSQSKVIIFDFDGTICDSYEAAMRIINDQSDNFGYRKMQSSELKSMRDLTMQEVLQSLGISNFKVPFIVRKIRKELNKEIKSLSPFAGMSEALLTLKSDGYAIGILTSNSEENVLQFAKKNKLELFDFIYSGTSIFGKEKVIKNLLKNINVPMNHATYVGDETRDIEAAKAVGIPVISVSWGFNSRKLLEAHHPTYLIDSPNELKSVLTYQLPVSKDAIVK